jgi:endonuclease YncB( thermonuclease family)
LKLLRLLPLFILLASPSQAATVLSIGDGDTLRVRESGRTVTIRLACIDAPEMAQRPWGAASRGLLVSLVPIGSEVSLRVKARDRYGRTVAEVMRGAQVVNLQLVRKGQAFAYRQYLRQCDAAAYLGAERAAETDRIGVWSQPGGITRPWDFRQARRERRSVGIPQSSGSSVPLGGTRYTCRQIGSYAQAQVLLRQGHTYLDSNGDGEACESLRR